MTAVATVAALAKPQSLVALVPVTDDHPDAAILNAWNNRMEALALLETRGRFYDAANHSPTEDAALGAQTELLSNIPATTIDGVICKLWLALAGVGGYCHTDEDRAEGDTIRRGDADAIATFIDQHDYPAALLFRTIAELALIRDGGR